MLSDLLAEYRRLDWPRRLVWLAAGLFPAISTAVPSGGSILFTLLILPALFQAWPERRNLDKQTRLWLFSYVALFLWGAVTLLYTESLNDGLERLERLLRLALLGVLVLWIVRLRIECGRIFVLGVGAAGIVMLTQSILALYANYTPYLHDGIRVQGLYGAIIFGDLAMLNAAILLAAAITIATTRWHYALLSAGVIVLLYASIVSYTRGAWLVPPLVMALLLWLYHNRIGRRQWVAAIAVSILLTISLATLFPEKVEQRIVQAIDEVRLYQANPEVRTSTGLRLSLWESSLHMWKEHPFGGVGLGDLQQENRRLVEEGVATHRDIGQFGHAHSIYFDALATLGGVGVALLLLALFILPLRWFLRHWSAARDDWHRFYALGGIITVTAFAVFGLTEGWVSRNPMVNPYILYVAVFASSLMVRRGPSDHLSSGA